MKRSALVGWSVGSFTSATLISAVGLLHLRFMTDSIGLAMAVAGALVVVSRVYDAVLDPIMGVLADRTRTPFGRYRPYLLAGGLLSALSLALMFNVPRALHGFGLVAYVIASLLFFSTAYTMYRIPYLAIGRSITQNFAERSRLMTFSVYGSSLGTMAATSAAPFLLAKLGSDRAGHGLVALVLAGCIACGCVISTLLIGNHETEAAEVPSAASHGLSARVALAALRDNRPFQRLMAFKLAMFTGLALHGSAIPYYTRYVLRVSDATLSGIFLAQTLAMMASQLVWAPLARAFGRRAALIVAGLGQTVVMLGWSLVPASSPTPWVQILGGCSGVFAGGIFFGLYTVLTDTMDFARRRTGGQGQEGILAGLFVMVEKATTAAGAFVFSVILGAVGYVSAHNAGATVQPPAVITGIYVAISLLPAAAAVLAVLFIRGYHLPAAADAAPPPGKPALAAATAVVVLALAGAAWLAPRAARAAEAPAPAAPGQPLTIPAHFKVPRVYAGADGKSRLDEVELPRVAGGDGRSVSTRLYVTDVEMGLSLPGTFIDWHGVSTPRLLVVLRGAIEVGLGDGSLHVLKAGDMVYVADTTGQGHTSRTIGNEPVEAMTLRLNRDDPLKPKLNSCPEGMAASACVANGLHITQPRR